MAIQSGRSIFAAACATLAALAASGCEKPAPPAPLPPEVYVAPVVQQDVPVYLDLVGQTQGIQDVDIRARVEGFLETMNFREGSFVRKGDLLYTSIRKPLRGGARRRPRPTWRPPKRGSRRRPTTSTATRRSSPSRPSASRSSTTRAPRRTPRSSQVDAATAAVEKATLDLGYTRVIVADRRSGRHHAGEAGQPGRTRREHAADDGVADSTRSCSASASPKPTTCASPSAIRRGPATRRRPAGSQLTLADGTVHPADRHASARVERAVNASTGTLGLQIAFPNPEPSLRPGQYGRARILLDTQGGALLVPQRAVQELQNLYSVAVVGSDNKVAFRNVKVGPRVDTLWVIEEGLEAGRAGRRRRACRRSATA